MRSSSTRLRPPRNGYRQEHRIFPISQGDLLKAGSDDATPRTKYTGDKWGGKYLRAPDIYWTILEKGKDKLVRLGDVAEVQRGFTTGANDFFYFNSANPIGNGLMRVINEDGWEGEIEQHFLRRVIRSPRNCYRIAIPDTVGSMAFWCHQSRESLRGTSALEYIRYGESEGYHTGSSVASRQNWYSLPEQRRANLFWPRAFFERFICYLAPRNVMASDRFFTIDAHGLPSLPIFLNTLLPYLWVELQGLQVNHGGIDTKVVLLEKIPVCRDLEITPSLHDIFQELRNRPIDLVSDEIERCDRQEFDYAVLSQIGLSKAEVRTLHLFVAESARMRILKARRRPTAKVVVSGGNREV